MVKAEKAFKWGIAIIVVFGTLNAFYFLNLVVALKIVLPILCVFMIGSILLQSGKGGGLAAIGGLGDQSAFGTRTSTFLTKITYLIGAAFIVATVFLFKLSIPTRLIDTMVTHEVPEAQHTHEHPVHEGPHAHGDVPHTEGQASSPSGMGMQDVIEESASKSVQESSQHQTGMQGGELQDQPAGMNPVKEEEQTSDVTKKSANEGHSETGKDSNK
jgi:protein translocase SecG subunit